MHVGEMAPYTGNIFKTSNFNFIEGRAYPFSDFVKEEYENKNFYVDATMYACGLMVSYSKERDMSEQTPYFERSKKVFVKDYLFDIKAGDLKNSYITFTEGSADNCKSVAEAKAFVFQKGNIKDKLTFTIKKKGDKDDDEYNGNIIKVSKSLYDKMKRDCSDVSIDELLKVKNLMLGSAISSGIGTAVGIAGTTMGAISIINNKKKNDVELNRKLDIGQTVTSAIGTASSATSLTTSAISTDKLKKLIEDIRRCKQSVSGLGIFVD